MNANERIEALLNRAKNTMKDLRPPEDCIRDDDAINLYLRTSIKEVEGIEVTGDTPVNPYEAIVDCLALGVHLVDVIERLCWALENTLDRYDKAIDRLCDLNDYEFVGELEGGFEDDGCVFEQCGRDCGCGDCASHVEEELDA